MVFSFLLLPLIFSWSSPISYYYSFDNPKISTASNVWPTVEWSTSSPEEQEMNSTYLSMMYDYIYDNSLDIGSVLIIRNGIIVEENYLENSQVDENMTQPSDDYNWGTLIYNNEGKWRNWYSTTKSVTSILIGIAIQNGFIDNVSQTFFEFFPDKWNSSYDPRKLNITIEHLLTMTSGIPWEVSSSVNWWIQYYNLPNYIDDVLALNLTNDPGTYFNNYSLQYSTDATNLLTAVINRSTGMYPEDFAQQYLFDPLNITDWGWYKDQEGINFGGSGLCMDRRDMAKIAYLCLNNGTWDGTQILSEEYLQLAITDHDGIINDTYQPYGYSFWLDNYTTNYSWYYAAGAFGQNFYVIPELDLIVLFNGFSLSEPSKSIILRDYIIPSILNYVDSTDPVITSTPSDFAVAHDYTGQSLSWTATDTNPDTYTITHNGTTTVVAATAWTNGTPVTFNIPDGLASGLHTYEINFSDTGGNNVSDSAVMTVNPTSGGPAIPGFEPLIVIGITAIGSIGLVVLKKKKK